MVGNGSFEIGPVTCVVVSNGAFEIGPVTWLEVGMLCTIFGCRLKMP